MANVVLRLLTGRLDLVAAILATGLTAAVLAGGCKWRHRLISTYSWFIGQVSGSRRLPDYPKLTGFPPPKPIPEFNIDTAKPRPYRPFRWEYYQTMSLKKLEPDWWIELESTYRERINQRRRLYAEQSKQVIDELPGSVFFNDILGVEVDINSIHPLVFLLEHVPEDFFITQEDPETGLYVLRAAVSCSAVGWNMSQKIGRPLHEIHGPVPDYKEKMAFSMNRFFSKMPCHKPIQRGSWGLEVGEPLFVQADEPEWALRQRQDPDLPLSNIYLRVDWQTLRRMPKSRAIVFNFKALFTPVTDFRREPCIPKLLLKVLLEGKKSIMEYKGTWHIEHKVIPALREWAEEQEENGLVPKGWQERTLDEDPFYPGWKDHYPMCA